jgi:bacillithiol system protein YtxJ
VLIVNLTKKDMGWFSTKKAEQKEFPWIDLTDSEDVENALKVSETKMVLFFKHSTRCSISDAALSRFERNFIPSSEIDLYFLDLIEYRDISNKIESVLKVQHQSPQVIVVQNNKVIYTESHTGIDAHEIQKLF